MADLPRYIEIPVERPTPMDVLGRLREIDPMAELFYAGDGWWWLGVVKPDAPRVEIARKTLEFWADKGIENAWPIQRTEILKSQGFGLISKTRNGDSEPDWGGLIEDFRQADFIWRNWGTPNEKVQAQLQESGVLEDEMRLKARAATVERMQADERYLFSRVIRKNPAPVTVGANIT